MKVLLLLALAVVFVSCHKPSNNHPLGPNFVAWKHKHGKNYTSDDEHESRFATWLANKEKASHLNKQHRTAVFGENSLSDLTHEEFKKLNGFKSVTPGNKRNVEQFSVNPQAFAVPGLVSDSAWDWTANGANTNIKDQGVCGSCWAHATTTITEKYALLGNPGAGYTELSQQELIDCNSQASGCNGGPISFDWVVSNGGLTAGSNYPPTSYQSNQQGQCQRPGAAVDISSWAHVTTQDDDSLANHLRTYGPMFVVVDANAWQQYTGGIMTASACGFDGNNWDHAVSLVAYDKNQGFWKIQNSWGTGWGENGYIRIQYGANACGVCGGGPDNINVGAPFPALNLGGIVPSPPSPNPPPPPPPPSNPPPSWPVNPTPVAPVPVQPISICNDAYGNPCQDPENCPFYCNNMGGCDCSGGSNSNAVPSGGDSNAIPSGWNAVPSGGDSNAIPSGWNAIPSGFDWPSNWAQADNAAPYQSSSNGVNLTTAQFAGIIVGAVVGALLLGFIAAYVVTKKRQTEHV